MQLQRLTRENQVELHAKIGVRNVQISGAQVEPAVTFTQRRDFRKRVGLQARQRNRAL